jgi:DNA mismatch endonuclease (patch repair protein)
MQLQRERDTGIELALRRQLHRRGFRYRLQQPIVPGTRRRVDIVFPSARVAVDVRGCYWHGHEHEFQAYERRHNLEYWTPKIAGNRARDQDTVKRLERAGWKVLIVWACDDLDVAADRIAATIRANRDRQLRAIPIDKRSVAASDQRWESRSH